jgi:hypothetical protein
MTWNYLEVSAQFYAVLNQNKEWIDEYYKHLLQIETDLLRTLPSNKHYECMDADGIPKLRRVLLAFSIYNASVGYCQVC